MRFWTLNFCLMWAGFVVSANAAEVGRIRVEGAIGPATASYIARAVEEAAGTGKGALIIELDTPGGLLDSTKQIIQTFYQSKVPTIVFVAPAGSTATSAGAFITIAADVAAMAPNTSIGAAHPVSVGGGGAEQPDAVMKQKLENYASSFIQSVAEKRGRNAQWAIAAVRDSESVTSEKALELKVIDLIAADIPELLKKVNGREINGQPLATAGAGVVDIPMLFRERLFSLLWRPEVMLFLMLAAVYGLIGELSNPGAILPGVVGGISLILALYMAAILPINVAGLAIIVLGIALLVVDLFAPSHGILTVGGLAAFFLGAVMLFDRAGPAFRLSFAYIIPAVIFTAIFFLFVAGKGIKAQKLPVRTGRESMIGQRAEVLQAIENGQGKVFVEGEYWNAVSARPAAAGQFVRIVAIDGLTLTVEPETKT